MMKSSGVSISARRSAGIPNVVGFEVDFGWSPNFFEDTAGDRNFEFGDSNVTTFMGNLLISAPPGTGLRPYVSAGLGLIRAQHSSRHGLFNDLSTNDLGVNIGGGINGQFSDNVGIRGDLRYFRSLQDNETGQRFRSVARQLRLLARHRRPDVPLVSSHVRCKLRLLRIRRATSASDACARQRIAIPFLTPSLALS